jgi:hypothetical protein
MGRHEDARRLGEEVLAIGKEHGYALWTTLGAVFAPPAALGGTEQRAYLGQVIATLRLMGQESFSADYLGHLAQLHAEVGEAGRALELVGEARDVVTTTGEDVHRPELLRKRGLYALADGRDVGLAVADLSEAARVATDQGARVARLRAALELARLPVGSRPDDWRTMLEDARADLPATLATSDTEAADALLAP